MLSCDVVAFVFSPQCSREAVCHISVSAVCSVLVCRDSRGSYRNKMQFNIKWLLWIYGQRDLFNTAAHLHHYHVASQILLLFCLFFLTGPQRVRQNKSHLKHLTFNKANWQHLFSDHRCKMIRPMQGCFLWYASSTYTFFYDINLDTIWAFWVFFSLFHAYVWKQRPQWSWMMALHYVQT